MNEVVFENKYKNAIYFILWFNIIDSFRKKEYNQMQ